MEITNLIITFFLGASIGSFFGAWIDRFSTSEDLPQGRSSCDNCKKQLSWYELIPVISFVVLLGRCSGCGSKIGLFKIVIETIFGLVALAWFVLPSSLNYLNLVVIFILLGLFFFDLRYFRLPDILTITLGIIGIVSIIINGFSFYYLISLTPAFIFGIMYLVSRGSWVGLGDVKLLLGLGLIQPYPFSVFVFLGSISVGSIIGILMIVLGRAKMASKIPFGSILSAVSILAILFNEEISKTIYWNFF